MSRTYIEKGFKASEGEWGCVNITLDDGTVYENVSLRRIFPFSDPEHFISVVDENGGEKFIIPDMSKLDCETADVLNACLNEYYMLPKITRIYQKSDKNGILEIDSDTNYGKRVIKIANRNTDIKVYDDGRVLIRDTSDNRYEIPDFNALDRKSRAVLDAEL